MEVNVNELLSLSDSAIVSERNLKKPKTKKISLKCVVYWINDKLVSTEPISAIENEEDATEGSVCNIKWRGKGLFLGKVIKISDDKEVLKLVQDMLEKDLSRMSMPESADLEEFEATPEQVSKKGRKRKLSRKILEQVDESLHVNEQPAPKKPTQQASGSTSTPSVQSSSNAKLAAKDGSAVHEKPAPKKRTPASATTSKPSVESSAKAKLAAKVAAQRSLCAELIYDDPPATEAQVLEPASRSPKNFTELLSDDCSMGLDGVARALAVANDESYGLNYMPYHYLDNEKDSKIMELESEVSKIQNELKQLSDLLKERDVELEELRSEINVLKLNQDRHEGTSLRDELNLTPRKVTFIRNLSSVLEGLTKQTAKGSCRAAPLAPETPQRMSSHSAEFNPTAGIMQATRGSPSDFLSTRTEEEKLELVKGTGVFVTVAQRTSIAIKGKKGVKMMLRKVLDTIFSSEELQSGCAVGGRQRAPNKMGQGCSRPLDSKRVNAAKAYIMCYCQKKGLAVLGDAEMNSIINSKCVSVRRSFRLGSIQ